MCGVEHALSQRSMRAGREHRLAMMALLAWEDYARCE